VRLEDQIDELHQAVADLGDQVGERLRDAKLAGLAELAAGAAHEINNPLAIISGNAQRLARTEPYPDRAESLQAIVRQANRIAGLLRDLMQFARPPKPEARAFAVTELVQAVRDELSAFASERGVRVEVDALPVDLWVEGDPKQLCYALCAVVRNAIEAAHPEGWVRITCPTTAHDIPTIIVEDSGAGLTPEVAEHAFDPFFCGRTAGRGRGLGLPTAWRLARQNGGDLRYEGTEQGPTRFVLTARRAVGYDLVSLRSA
jgi:C4-dicarboxylate-specific signal transduction histidine kinase